MDLSLEHGKPVCLGVSGPGVCWNDAVRQAGAEAYGGWLWKLPTKCLTGWRSFEALNLNVSVRG